MKKLKEIRKGLFPSNRYGWIALLFLIVLIPNFFVALQATDLAGNAMKQLAYLFLSCLILLIPAFFLRARAYFVLCSLFLLLSPVEISHIVLNRMPVTEGYVDAILQTNRMEALELLSFVKLYLLSAVVLFIFYYWILFTKVDNTPLLTRKGKYVIGMLFIVFNLCLWAMMWKLSGYAMDETSRLKETHSNFFSKYTKTYPLDMICATRDVFISRREVRKMESRLEGFSFGITRQKDISQREIYVLVIGESARYGNFSLNGYSRPTSPLLEQQTRLISYQDVLSTANLTTNAMQLMLTRATPLDPGRAHKEKAITDAFKEAGFQVAWIANQSVSDRFIQRITRPADYTFFSTTDYDSADSYDGKLIVPMEEVLAQKNLKQLIVFHTLGSHFRYNSRYPDDFRLFNPALQDNTTYGVTEENKELLVNSYDNSIYYTDYVLHEIIRRIEAEEAVSGLVYLSDHGENLYDEGAKMAVHGNAIPSRLELHVPLFIWTSPLYEDIWPEKVSNMEANREKPLSSSHLFSSLLDIAGMAYPGEEKQMSIASPILQADSVRYVLTPGREVMEIR